MAEKAKNYRTVVGTVQQFGEQDLITEREVNGVTIHEFTVRTCTANSKGQQSLVKVTVWPEVTEWQPMIVRGALVGIDGNFSTNEGTSGKTFFNITANSISSGDTSKRAERQETTAVEKSTDDLDF